MLFQRNKAKRIPAEGEEAPANVTSAAEGDAPKRGRTKKPRAPRVPRAEGEDPAGEPSKTMLFVANLGFNTDDASLSTLFTENGINVVSARIVRRRWGQPRKSKGYGFVDVGSEAEQKKAIEALDNKDVGGRNIAVKIAVNTPQEEEGQGADTKPESAVIPEATVVAS
jgi:RNA recognition motif-containing protein